MATAKSIKEFSQTTAEALGYYVYALIDPRDNRIFYVGKGIGNRVFAHVTCAESTDAKSDKLDTIRAIKAAGKEVKHYILRHGLKEDEAFLVESVFIDFLTFRDFDFVANITNLQAGHHQWNEGIKTVEELNILYDCGMLEEKDFKHKVMSININKSYLRHPDNIFEATCGTWKLSEHSAKQVEYVFGEYKGIVRAIFKPTKWLKDSVYTDRWRFEGEEVTDKKITDLYLHKAVPQKSKGAANPIRYFG